MAVGKFTDHLDDVESGTYTSSWNERIDETRSHRCSNTYKILFYTLLSFNLVLVPFLVLDTPIQSVQAVKNAVHRRSAPAHSQNLVKQLDMFGGIGRQIVTFDEDQRFWSEPSANDSAWKSIQPKGTGHILVWDAPNYNLSGGFPMQYGLAEEYSMTVFHQLHCLAMIKTELNRQTLRYPAPEHTHENANHIPHCFDYIRQGLMCAGDMTLEKAKVNADGVRIRDVNGWGVEHECKNWDDVMRWSEKHRSDDSEAIVPDWFALEAGFKHFEDRPQVIVDGNVGHSTPLAGGSAPGNVDPSAVPATPLAGGSPGKSVDGNAGQATPLKGESALGKMTGHEGHGM